MADYLNNAAESAEDKRKRWEAAFEEGRQRVAQGNRYKQYMDEHFGVTDQQRRQAYQSSGMDRMRIDLSALENDIRSGTARTSRVNSMVSAIQKQRAYFQRYADYFTPEELQGFEQELSGHEQILTGEQDRVREAAAQRQTARRSATSHIDLYHRQQQTQQPDLMQRAQTGAALGAPMGQMTMPIDQTQRRQLGILTPQEQRAQAQRGMELRKTYGDSYDVELAAKKKAEAEADARKLYERKKAYVEKREAEGWNSPQEKESEYRRLEYYSKRLGTAQAEKMRFSSIRKEYGEKTMDGLAERMQEVGKEISASQKRVEQLTAERSRAEHPGGRRVGNQWVSTEADSERLAELDREIKNEQRKQKILEGQQKRIVQDYQTAYFYKYTALQNREDFEEKSAYRTTRKSSDEYRGGLDHLYKDVYYDYINGDPDAQTLVLVQDDYNTKATHEMWKDLPEETVRIFNYLYATEGKDAAYEYMDTAVQQEYTWMQAAGYGLAKGTGLASLYYAGKTGLSSFFGGEDAKKGAVMDYRQFQQDAAGAAQQYPISYYASNTVGNLGLMAATGGVAGKVVGAAGGAASGAIGGRVATGALSFATAQAIRDMGEAATGGITAGEYGKNIIVSGIQGAAGNLAYELVSSGLMQKLTGAKERRMFGEYIRNVAASMSSATVNQAIGYLAADEKPSAWEVASGLFSSFAFSLIDGGFRTMRTTRAAKQQLENMYEEMMNQYMMLLQNNQQFTPQQAAERVQAVYQYSRDLQAKLDTTYLAGQEDAIAQMQLGLDNVAAWAYEWIAQYQGAATPASGWQTAPSGGLSGGMPALPETAGQGQTGPTMPTQPVNGGTPEQAQQTPEQSQQVQELQQEIAQAMTEGLTGNTGMTASGAADVPTQIEAPKAENVTEIDNGKPEADSAAGIEAGAAADNTLPEAQLTRPAQDIRKEERNGTRTERLPNRNGGRLAGAGTGGQTGGLGRGRPQGTAQQSRTAIQRQNTARSLQLQKVSSRELGLEQGTDEKNLQIFPIGAWDDELKETVSRLEEESGKHVTVVLGQIQIKTKSGMKKVRGVYNNDGIILQADNLNLMAEQIGNHELMHHYIRENPGLAQQVENEIVEQYGREEMSRTIDKYIERLRGVVDLQEGMTDREYNEALQRVKDEILCDAYAGINAFGAHAEQYQEQAQRVMQRRGIGRKSKENAAALARRGVGDDGKTKFSYAGERAKTADVQALRDAQEMEAVGADMESIRKATGWHKGRDGKWRFEIDDSGAEYRKHGDARLLQEEGYRRLMKLTDKWAASYEKGGAALTEAEESEMVALQEAYSDRVWEEKYELQDFLKHEKLFEAYPMLRHATLKFQKLDDGTNGYYSGQDNTIVLSTDLIGKPEKTLLHEIQHAIQAYEGFSGGTSPEYWARRDYENGTSISERMQKQYDNLLNGLSREEQNRYIRYMELERELGRLFLADENSEDGRKYAKLEAEQDKLYEELWPNEWFRKLLDLDRKIGNPSEGYYQMYRNSAGEIEARDSESRRALTAEQRRETAPDYGDEETVLPERGDGYSIVEPFTDQNGKRYENAVLLDTDFFDGISPRNWGQKLKKYVESRAETSPFIMTVQDENGNSQAVQFARIQDRVKKGGNVHPALTELYETSDNISKLAVIHVDEIAEISEESNPYYTGESSHGWLDKHGWLHRNANVINARNGAIYNLTLDIAKAEDGRTILYATKGKIKKVGNAQVHSLKIRGAEQNSNFVGSIHQNAGKSQGVDEKYSLDEEPAAELEERPKKKKKAQPVAESLPIIAKRELKQNLLNLFSIPQGMRADLGGYVDHIADKIVKNGALTQEERDEFFDRMYSSGVMEVAADEYYQTARQDIVGRRIYVPEEVKHEFGDDWNQFRRNAFSAGVLLTNQRSDNAIDTLNMELAENLPGLFDANETDSRSILERIVQMADEGRSEQMSLNEYAAWLAGQDYVSEDEVLDNIERQMDWALRTFAEKAGLEIRLRDRTGVKIAQEREKTAEARLKASEARGRYAEKAEVLQQEYDERVQKINDRANAKIKEARDETANARMRAAEQRGRFADREQELKDHFYDRERKIREREKLKWAEARQHRKEMNQQQRERRELRELQPRVLKQFQWLSKNQYRAPEELREKWQELLSDFDIYAIGAANATHYSNKYGATWENVAEMYKEAQANDPNFLPSKELERIVARLDNRKIEDMDLGALQDLYKALVGLRTEFYNRNNVIGDEHNRMFEEVYEDSKRELTASGETKGAKAARNGGKISKFLNQDQLSPMNVMQRMGGWNPKGTFYTMARQLEKGERDIRAYTVRANKELEDVLTEYADFVRRADGQGKDAIWYEVEVPELMELGMGDKPIFGDTVKVYMTPSQKIHMYLESKNYENLRHMAGGRTFADKKLYSEGKRREAFAQGKTIRLAPETVKTLVRNLTPEEQAIADALERYYNQFAKREINRVSNLLYGYDKAVSKNYTPIYTNTNYTKSEMGVYNATAEGVGNLKQRQYSKNPSYNIGAFDAFERHVEQTARFVGMAVPARNWQTLLNWRESNDSMADVITHSWGDESLRYIQDLVTSLQAGKDGKNDTVSTGVEKFFSNYISAVFGANPSIVLKQLGSIPLAGVWLDFKNLPSVGQIRKIDRDLIGKYTQELAWRTMGYSTPETKQLKENPNWTQRNKTVQFALGGGAITAMDGWAASVLWPWAENKVRRENPELEIGTQEEIENGSSKFYKKVAEVFNEAVARSQSTSDEMHQGTLRKSKNPLTRAFTMFKSDASQTYNAWRQTAGEARYYRQSGDETASRKAKHRVGIAFLAATGGYLWAQGIAFLMNLWKHKGKAYRNDDGELTFGSVAEEMALGLVGDLAGVVAGGEEAADILGNILTGEKWYGIDTPGMEQINDVIETIITQSKGAFAGLKNMADIVANDGDLGEYLHRNAGDITGGMKELAETIATYVPGISVNNLEAYLLGTVKWASPELATAYEDALQTSTKGDLKGLTGDALAQRVESIFSIRRVELDANAADAVAALYEAGFTGAVPVDTPSSLNVGDESRELGAYQKQVYDKVWSNTVNDTMQELLASDEFAEASDAAKEKMLKALYSYAGEQAKAVLFEDYTADTAKADAVLNAGASMTEWLTWVGQSGTLEPETGKESVSATQKYKLLRGLDYSDKVKFAIAGSVMGTEMKTENGTKSQYAKMLDIQKGGLSADQYLNLRIEGAVDKYLKQKEAGASNSTAYQMAMALDKMPEETKPVEKWRTAIKTGGSQKEQLAALKVFMSEVQYDKVEIATYYNIKPDTWVKLNEMMPEFDEDGNGSYKKGEIENAIDALGDRDNSLASAQKAALWQLMTGSTSAKNNPYNTVVAQEIIDERSKRKADREESKKKTK